ncbi:MAG: type II toxin-antitoxin system VapC family toxin [Verrucomicrobiales bacterium]|nr:type II toxin-antitoxin system VapC family toxin [Verrucomicrobiales bacterium]
MVDSSAWLEDLCDTERADLFAEAIEKPAELVVPSICLYEVGKKVSREFGEDAAAQIYALMSMGTVVDLDASLAMDAAAHHLPLADSIIYETALRYRAVLWTQDAHFDGLSNVKYFSK